MRINRPGRYFTRSNRVATIYRIDGDKAHGRIPKYYDTTWWYVHNAEHAMCPSDDIVAFVDLGEPLVEDKV
jgi:hypothetical protein